MNQKELLLITLGIFLTVIAWLMADIYHVSKVKKQVEIRFDLVGPAKIKIDNKIFTELGKKSF